MEAGFEHGRLLTADPNGKEPLVCARTGVVPEREKTEMAAEIPSTPPQPPPARKGWGVGRILLIILGSIVALLGAGLLAAGGTLLWADQTQRDEEGFLTTPTERFERDSYAITSDNIDLFEADSGEDWILTRGVLGDVNITSENVDGSETFVGIGRTVDVRRYLADVQHDEVRDLDFDPFSVTYRRIEGGEQPGPPADQTFWAASASGAGEQTATWEPESGNWTIVVMNADSSKGVAVELSAGAKASFLLWLAIGLMIGGGLLLAVATILIVIGARGGAGAAPAAAAAEAGRRPRWPLPARRRPCTRSPCEASSTPTSAAGSGSSSGSWRSRTTSFSSSSGSRSGS